jgi:hypothetical protein
MADETLGELADRDPIGTLLAICAMVNAAEEESGRAGAARVATEVARENGLNIFRLMNRFPDRTREETDLEPPFEEDFVERFDELLEC